ncbi:MAG: OmpA family protein [Acetobacter sp.]|nr:OmpA family protein [Acetobacter sp.]
MRFRSILLTTALTAAPVVASATTITGPYVDVGGGYNLVQDQHVHANTPANGAAVPKFSLRHNTGFTGFGSFGWGFGNGLRAEVEGNYNFSHVNFGAHYIGPGQAGGYHNTDESYGAFVNVLYDIDLKHFGINSPVTPFLGVGGGYLWQRYNNVTNSQMKPSGYAINGTNGGFAWQGIVGAAIDTGLPGLQVTAQYRMIGQPGSFMDGAYQYGTDGGHANFDQRWNHQFILGLRYAFDTAPPAPPAPPPPPAARPVVAPAPLPARSYLVFFDWDKYTLTTRARQIVAEAAQASTHVRVTRIEVNGYTDNSAARPGPAGQKYNLGLSIRRAKSVKAELVRDGVPASVIDIHGYGEAHPLVPTGPNTREPQNRRVEIILH